MPRYRGGRTTVESCRSIDVLRWHRLGYLRSPCCFVWAWTRNGEPVASIGVEIERHFVTLRYRTLTHGSEDWNDVEQCIQINWSPCRFGGERPWFACSVRSNGRFCGRRVTKLYGAGGGLFACRHCCKLAYASQQESTRYAGARRAQKIRMRLGGSGNMLDPFPDKPKGMHWRTYDWWRRTHDIAARRSDVAMMPIVQRVLVDGWR